METYIPDQQDILDFIEANKAQKKTNKNCFAIDNEHFVSKVNFVKICRKILRPVKDNPIPEKVKVLLESNLPNESILQLLDLTQDDVKFLMDGIEYPYLISAWNRYFDIIHEVVRLDEISEVRSIFKCSTRRVDYESKFKKDKDLPVPVPRTNTNKERLIKIENIKELDEMVLLARKHTKYDNAKSFMRAIYLKEHIKMKELKQILGVDNSGKLSNFLQNEDLIPDTVKRINIVFGTSFSR